MATSKYDLLFNEEEKEKIRNEYLNGSSIRELAKKYNIKSKEWLHKRLLKGITRNFSQALIVAHKKYPESFKHDEEYKKKMRQIRLQYMKEHPEETAWRKRNEPSYPEKCFIKFLQENNYDKKYLIEREKSIFPYFIDFAFINEKLAVEIDGSQHIKDDERKKRDVEKDELLISKGWKILRVTENMVKTDWVTLKEKLDLLIESDIITSEKVGIFISKKENKKVKRNKCGITEKMEISSFNQRKVKNRPTLEEIENLQKKFSMVKIGKIYGVSDNAIRKWIKYYKKHNN